MSLSPQIVLDRAAKLINDRGFVPTSARVIEDSKKTTPKRAPSPVTLHEAIREAMGMEFDDADVAYWEWKSIRKLLSAVWQSLDLSATELAGKPERAAVVASRQDSDAQTITSILNRANPGSTPIVERVTRRPDKFKGIPLPGKVLWSIVVTIGVLKQSVGSDLGDLLSSLTDLDRTNFQLLEHLDSQVEIANIDVGAIEVLESGILLRALGRAIQETNRLRRLDDLQNLSVSQFLIEMEQSANWSGSSDPAVLRRLLTIAPDTAKMYQPLISEFLNG